MKVAVVIPNWNGSDMIAMCLKSLEAQTRAVELVVVDNGSSDDSVKIIKEKFPTVTLLEFNDNAGFAGGVNRGIRYAIEKNFTYIALFNNDSVADKNWLENLVKEIEINKGTGIVTGKFMRSDKQRFDSTGDFYTIWGMPFPRGRNHKDVGQFDTAEDVFGATGGASLYRVKMLEDIGLFDEDFFAYYEDVDISLRARLAGWNVRYIPSAVAYHKVGGTSSKLGDFARYHSAKNLLLLYSRSMPTRLFIKYLPFFCLQIFVRMPVTAILRGKPKAYFTGTWAAIKLHRKTFAVRKQNLAKQRISSKELDRMLTHSRPPRIPAID